MSQIPTDLLDKLVSTSKKIVDRFEVIPSERKILLEELGIYIKGRLISQNEVNLVFICTHNSRRSHLAQVWAKAASHYFNISNIHTFSGGTVKTAFNTNAVEVLKKAGFKIKLIKEGSNPRYRVQYDKRSEPIICFSKKFDHKSNPQNGFVAVMTCSDADESCPVISGAEYRTTIQYDDPKIYDGTSMAAQMYEERSMQIATEMYYVFSKIAEFNN